MKGKVYVTCVRTEELSDVSRMAVRPGLLNRAWS